MMTKQEAIEHCRTGNGRVITKGGVEYWLDRGSVEAADDAAPYVYGFRVKLGGSVRGRVRPGTVRWFFLENVTPSPTTEERS